MNCIMTVSIRRKRSERIETILTRSWGHKKALSFGEENLIYHVYVHVTSLIDFINKLSHHHNTQIRIQFYSTTADDLVLTKQRVVDIENPEELTMRAEVNVLIGSVSPVSAWSLVLLVTSSVSTVSVRIITLVLTILLRHLIVSSLLVSLQSSGSADCEELSLVTQDHSVDVYHREEGNLFISDHHSDKLLIKSDGSLVHLKTGSDSDSVNIISIPESTNIVCSNNISLILIISVVIIIIIVPIIISFSCLCLAFKCKGK